MLHTFIKEEKKIEWNSKDKSVEEMAHTQIQTHMYRYTSAYREHTTHTFGTLYFLSGGRISSMILFL